MLRRPPRSTLDRSSAASDVYKRQLQVRLVDPLGECLVVEQSEDFQHWIPVGTNRAGGIFTQPVDPSRSQFIRVRTL